MTKIYEVLRKLSAAQLFDDVLRKKQVVCRRSSGGGNPKATVSVYKDMRDFVQANRQEFPQGVRLIRLDYSGILKILNKIGRLWGRSADYRSI